MADFDVTKGRMKITDLFEDSAYRLWIGTAANGLLVRDGTNLFNVETSQNNIHTITEDHEGNIWVGTDGGGLDRLRQRVIELHGRGEGLPFETVRSLCEDSGGDLWVVTQDGAVTRLTGNQWTNSQPNLGWPGGQAHWRDRRPGGFRLDRNLSAGFVSLAGRKFFPVYDQGWFGRRHGAIAAAGRGGDLWIGLETSLVQRFHDGHFESFTLPSGCRAVRAMVEDAAGQIGWAH